jgi:transposase InsO family protein
MTKEGVNMPWKAVSVMSLRKEFVTLAEVNMISFSELCRRFNISRKTGYKWLNRYRQEGEVGLGDRSRRPHRIARRISASMEQEILKLRKSRYWGARKIRKRLQVLGRPAVPAASTITAVLHRHGMIDPDAPEGRKNWQRFERSAPNDLWQTDFKAPVKTLGGHLQPLTVLDDHSRYSLGVRALESQKTVPVQDAFTEMFRLYGLPNAMLMDNGTPWGGAERRPFTVFSVWLIRLGIQVIHSRPNHPQTLGKDERFHRTLERELISRQQWRDRVHLQTALNKWCEQYNFERPHDSLALEVPASRYQPSLRPFPEQLPPIEYPDAFHVRKVQDDGCISFRGQLFKVGKAFHRYPVGLRPTQIDGTFEVMFCHQRIATIDLNANS